MANGGGVGGRQGRGGGARHRLRGGGKEREGGKGRRRREMPGGREGGRGAGGGWKESEAQRVMLREEGRSRLGGGVKKGEVNRQRKKVRINFHGLNSNVSNMLIMIPFITIVTGITRRTIINNIYVISIT